MLKKLILFIFLFSPNLCLAKYLTVKSGNECIHIFDDEETDLSIFTWKTSFPSMSQVNFASYPQFSPAFSLVLRLGFSTFGTEKQVFIVDSLQPFHEYIMYYRMYENREPSGVIVIQN